MLRIVSKCISVIFHPLIMPVAGVMLIFMSGTGNLFLTYEKQKYSLLVVFIVTFLIPLSTIPFFIYQQLIKNAYMPSARERLIPFGVTAIFYYAAFYLIKNQHIMVLLEAFLFSSFITLVLTIVITFFWKISAHAIGIGGLAGTALFIHYKYPVDITWWLMLIILAAGLTGFARLYLNEHRPSQIYSGFAVGCATVLLTISCYYLM